MSKYDYETKLKIVRENEQGYGRKYLSDKYGLKESTIENWNRKYEECGFESLCGMVGNPKKKGDSDMPKDTNNPKKLNKSEREELIELRERNQYLEAENLYLKKLDALLQKERSQTKRRHK